MTNTEFDIFVGLAITFGTLVVTFIGLAITLLVELWKGDL